MAEKFSTRIEDFLNKEAADSKDVIGFLKEIVNYEISNEGRARYKDDYKKMLANAALRKGASS